MKQLLLSVAFVATTASAQSYWTGNDLTRHLGDTGVTRGAAIGYVTGVADVLGYAEIVCTPSSVTTGQMADMVHEALKRSPEIRHLGAHQIVTHTLKTAFPCAAAKKGTAL